MEEKEVYIGVYKEDKLAAVMEWLRSEYIDPDTIDTLHDMGFTLKKIEKQVYDDFVNQDGIEWEDLPYDGIIDIDLSI
jgi:hypothetical protein